MGGVVGVTDMDASFKLYKDILKYDKVLLDETGTFEDWAGLPGGDQTYRRVILVPSNPGTGGFASLMGPTRIEVVQARDRKGRFLFEDRSWADTGIGHLGFDIRGMKPLGKALDKEGFGFRCDSNEALNMGDHTRVHCTYIDDPDEAWIEMIEVHKIPILEKLGLFLDAEAPRQPALAQMDAARPAIQPDQGLSHRAIQLSDTFDGCCIDMKFHARFSTWLQLTLAFMAFGVVSTARDRPARRSPSRC